MQLQFNQKELEQAVRDYVAKMGIRCQVTDMTFTATRGDQGIQTEVTLSPIDAEKTPGFSQPRSLKSLSEPDAEAHVSNTGEDSEGLPGLNEREVVPTENTRLFG